MSKANNIGYASLSSYNYNPRVSNAMSQQNYIVVKPQFSASAGYSTGYWNMNANGKQNTFGYNDITKAYGSCDIGGCTSAKLKALI